MFKKILLAWTLLHCGAELVLAQTAPSRGPTTRLPELIPISRLPEKETAQTTQFCCEDQPFTPRIWVQGEYLMWFLKNASPSFPLLTTGDPVNDLTAGALGSPSTRVLFHGNDLDHNMFSGMRWTLGGWMDQDQLWGLEGNVFLLEQRREGFSMASDGTGNPPLYVPVFLTDPVFNSEGKFFVADPTVPFDGSIAVTSSTRFWGAEVNAIRNLVDGPGLNLDFLFGFRFLDLQDSLNVQAFTPNDPIADIQGFLREKFRTRNDFYGGQFGTRLGYRRGPLTLGLTGKVALGTTHQISNVDGFTTLTGTGVPVLNPILVSGTTYPGAIFAQSSNIGRQNTDLFTVVPQVQVKVAWDIGDLVRVFAGYDFLFWNQVVRPGDQIDRRINSAQSPLSPNFGTPINPATPVQMFNRSDFWAHGVNLGLEIHY